MGPAICGISVAPRVSRSGAFFVVLARKRDFDWDLRVFETLGNRLHGLFAVFDLDGDSRVAGAAAAVFYRCRWRPYPLPYPSIRA